MCVVNIGFSKKHIEPRVRGLAAEMLERCCRDQGVDVFNHFRDGFNASLEGYLHPGEEDAQKGDCTTLCRRGDRAFADSFAVSGGILQIVLN